MQEMSLAVLEYDKPASCEFLLELAGNRAKMYLRYEALRGKMSLGQAREPVDISAARIANLNTLIDSLLERGIPVEWIEEVIGYRLEVA